MPVSIKNSHDFYLSKRLLQMTLEDIMFCPKQIIWLDEHLTKEKVQLNDNDMDYKVQISSAMPTEDQTTKFLLKHFK